MASPAKQRRRSQLARRRTKTQADNRKWTKREARGVHVLSARTELPNLRDVTLFCSIALLSARPSHD